MVVRLLCDLGERYQFTVWLCFVLLVSSISFNGFIKGGVYAALEIVFF